MHFLRANNSDRQTRLLNVFRQIAMFWEIKKICSCVKVWNNRVKIEVHGSNFVAHVKYC